MTERAWRTASRVLILYLLVTMFGSPEAVAQQDANTLQVLDIKVDITDRSAEAARDKALANGERQAYDELMSRLTSPQEAAALSSVTAAEISALVKEFWVADEKVSAVRYLATLNYTFYRDRVYEHLRQRQVAAPALPAEPLVVVPVYEGPAGNRLWEFDNPWRLAWQAAAPTSLLPLQLPGGDPLDQVTLSAEQALAGDEAAIRLLANQYSSREVVVAVAQQTGGSLGQPASVRVEMIRFPAAGSPSPATYTGEPDELAEALLRRAADGSVAALEATWKSTTPAVDLVEQMLPVAIPVSSFEDWNTIRRRLNYSQDVKSVAIVVLARQMVRVEISYFGDVDRLRESLLSSGLALSDLTGEWSLSLTTPSQTSATNPTVTP